MSATTQGDVLVLDTGDRVVADGLYISGHNLVIDEASLTGESDPKKKSEEKPWLRSGTQVHPVGAHFCLLPHMRGWRRHGLPYQPARHQGKVGMLDTQVTEGDARMLVLAVGTDSEWGRTMALVSGDSPPTPLQEKLTVLAGTIAKVGLTVAILAFVVLMVRYAQAPMMVTSVHLCMYACARLW